MLRDRPFNLQRGVMVFCFVQKKFCRQHKSQNIYFFCCAKRKFFFPEFNIRLHDKNSESDYFFFPPPKSEYFFQQHWESEYFFRKKNITLPLQVKWSFPKDIVLLTICISSYSVIGVSLHRQLQRIQKSGQIQGHLRQRRKLET